MKIDAIKNGIVIDHIEAGKGRKVYELLGLEELGCTVALFKNLPSKKTGKKDIIKIDADIELDFEVLGYIAPETTVNIIKDEKIESKIRPEPPKFIKNVIKCKNPRCITTTENYVAQKFKLVNKEKAEYACEYCDQIHSAGTDF